MSLAGRRSSPPTVLSHSLGSDHEKTLILKASLCGRYTLHKSIRPMLYIWKSVTAQCAKFLQLCCHYFSIKYEEVHMVSPTASGRRPPRQECRNGTRLDWSRAKSFIWNYPTVSPSLISIRTVADPFADLCWTQQYRLDMPDPQAGTLQPLSIGGCGGH